ncbi:hypothetical protein ZOSMA_1429G00010 [Zostera marina]|uniref:Uncharacterized protein n=1 Tax=Zostera marina TaxID=29655 RepID=A0A0K9PXJ9_ZOSMR|nr:hypothetical protein ZOSMA_1429G00010 [Zostera marina]
MMISSYYLDQCDCLKATEEESRGSLERIQKSNKVSLRVRVSGIEGFLISTKKIFRLRRILPPLPGNPGYATVSHLCSTY